MNSMVIFQDKLYLYVTVFAFAFFVLCTMYLNTEQKKSAIAIGLKSLLIGFVIDFISVFYADSMGQMLSEMPAETLLGIALLLKVLFLAMFVISATCFIMGKNSGIGYALLIICCGGCLVVYNTWMSPNGMILNLLYGLLPTIGFIALTTSYLTRCFRKHSVGYKICSATLLYVTYKVTLSISPSDIFALQTWYVGVIGYAGMGVGALLMLVDLKKDDLDNAELQIAKFNNKLKDIIRLSPFPIMISRLSDDSILLTNNAFLRMFGITERELENYRFKNFFVDAENRQSLSTQLEQKRVVNDFEIFVKKPKEEDKTFWLSTSANIIDYDYDIAIYAAFQDITDRKKHEELLKTQATKDPLTSLFNRRYFEEEINRRINEQSDSKFCVFMIDADHFKSVNDTYGHKVGDKVLVALSSTAQKSVREIDVVSRYGGEEFIVYLSDVDGEEAKAIADNLREEISKLTVYSDENQPFHFTVSIGIASSMYSRNLGELVKMADDALYIAKESGRNRCIVYNPEGTAQQEPELTQPETELTQSEQVSEEMVYMPEEAETIQPQTEQFQYQSEPEAPQFEPAFPQPEQTGMDVEQKTQPEQYEETQVQLSYPAQPQTPVQPQTYQPSQPNNVETQTSPDSAQEHN